MLAVQDLLLYCGAKFICPGRGAISLMPGTGSDPAFRRVEGHTKSGKVTGMSPL